MPVIQLIALSLKLRYNNISPLLLFVTFPQLEERVQCSKSGQVKYTTQETCLLTLPVPMAAATNKDEVEAWNVKKCQLEENKERV